VSASTEPWDHDDVLPLPSLFRSHALSTSERDISAEPSSFGFMPEGQLTAAVLLGGDNESLRTKAGSSVLNWPDLSRKVGARGGDHDTVRRVAKEMQRRLPEMMKRGNL